MSTSFNVQDHTSYRNKRYLSANIGNPLLLGLGVVEVNPTELCNRTCSFCPRSNPEVYPNRNLQMDIAVAEKLVNDLTSANYTGDIHITGFGEPTLNPKIFEIIKIFSAFYTEIITNGDRLLSGQMTHQQFSDAGLSMLIVDCYDGDEQYNKMIELLKDCKIGYRIRNHHDTGGEELFEQYNYNNRGGLVQKAETVFRPCWLPFYKAFVDWDGQIRLCCNDWSRSQIPFGDINNESFADIWMSKDFVKVREKLNKGERSKLAACKNCNTSGTQTGFESVSLWQKIF